MKKLMFSLLLGFLVTLGLYFIYSGSNNGTPQPDGLPVNHCDVVDTNLGYAVDHTGSACISYWAKVPTMSLPLGNVTYRYDGFPFAVLIDYGTDSGGYEAYSIWGTLLDIASWSVAVFVILTVIGDSKFRRVPFMVTRVIALMLLLTGIGTAVYAYFNPSSYFGSGSKMVQCCPICDCASLAPIPSPNYPVYALSGDLLILGGSLALLFKRKEYR